jgi:hypothetical protein
MRDLFYVILIVWILWRIIHSVNRYNAAKAPAKPSNPVKPDSHIDVDSAKRKMADKEGEYVDFEDISDK